MAYNSKFTGAEIDDAVRDGEWYNLRCIQRTPNAGRCSFDRLVVIENFVPKLLGDEYRLVYMHERRRGGRGLNWSIPLFGTLRGTLGARPLAETCCAVTGSCVAVTFDSTCTLVERRRSRFQFDRTRNTRLRRGYALFKHTGVGAFGWQRVSNIVGLMAFTGNKKTMTPTAKIDWRVFTE